MRRGRKERGENLHLETSFAIQMLIVKLAVNVKLVLDRDRFLGL